MNLVYLYSLFALVGFAFSIPTEPGGSHRSPAIESLSAPEDFQRENLVTADVVPQAWLGQTTRNEYLPNPLIPENLLSQASEIEIVDVDEALGQADPKSGIIRILQNGELVRWRIWLQVDDFESDPNGGPETKASAIYQLGRHFDFSGRDGRFATNALKTVFLLSGKHNLKLTLGGMNKLTTYTTAVIQHAEMNGVKREDLSPFVEISVNFRPQPTVQRKRWIEKEPSASIQRRSELLSTIESQVSSSPPEASTAAFVQSTLTYYTKLQANVTSALLPFVESVLTSNNTLLRTLALPLYGMTSPTTLVLSSPFAPGLMARSFDSFDTQAQFAATGNSSETGDTIQWLRGELSSRWDKAEKVVNATGELLVMKNIQIYLGLLDLNSNGTDIFPKSYYEVQTDKTMEGILDRLGVNGTG